MDFTITRWKNEPKKNTGSLLVGWAGDLKTPDLLLTAL